MVNEEHRRSFIVSILEAPADPTPRLVWADYIEEHGNANETPQLLREDGHWEMRSAVLYWIVDPPWSNWTHLYLLRVAALGMLDKERDEDPLEPPFKYVGYPPFGCEEKYLKCWVCSKCFVTGRWHPDVNWSCLNCWDTMMKTAHQMNWTLSQLWASMIRTGKMIDKVTTELWDSRK